MSGNLTGGLFETHGARRFLSTLREDLVNRRNLLTLLPPGISVDDVWAALRGEVSSDFHVQEVRVCDLQLDHGAVTALGEELDAHWPDGASRTVANLMHCDGLPEVIFLDGIEHLTDVQRSQWLELLDRWVRAAEIAETATPVLCIIASARSPLAQIPDSTNIKLSVRWWWGVLSISEVRLLYRHNSDAEMVTTSWREHLLTSLSGDDLELIEYLWDDELDPVSLIPRLQAFAEWRGWTAQTLRGLDARALIAVDRYWRNEVALSPPELSRALLSEGIIQGTPEYGLELHAAALAVLGRAEDIRHRCWRGQSSLLLPLTDKLRLLICDDLTNTFGGEWPTRWCLPEEESEVLRNDPNACQWGHLVRVLSACPDQSIRKRWDSLARQLRTIRNELAHYRPIRFSQFRSLASELSSLRLPVLN